MPLRYPFASLLTLTTIENKAKSPPLYPILASRLGVHATTPIALLEGEHHGGVRGHDVLPGHVTLGHLTLTTRVRIAGVFCIHLSSANNFTKDVQLRIALFLRLMQTSKQELCAFTSRCTPV